MGYIRRLEVKGFKSFGTKLVTLNFEPGLTAVTGPNGSGKSNIADAILFALGENSPRTLRAAQGRLTGLIYDPKKEAEAGATPAEVKPSACRVTIQFDNSDRKIPIDTETVTITRELRNDGENFYYLNGKKNTKGTISDLLDVGGLSPSGLNIIPQNATTRVADLTSDEKRKMIEEVVGISRFDDKKADAQKQLNQADTKLQIELARTGEMKAQLEKLEAQRNDLLRFSQLENQVNWLRAVQTSRRIIELRERLSSLSRIEEDLTRKLDEVRRRKQEFETRIASAEGEKDRFTLEIVQGGGPGPTGLRDQRESTKFRLDRLTSEVQTREENLTRLETETIPSLRAIISEKRKQVAAAESTVESLFSTEEKLAGRRKEVSSQLDELRRAEETLRATIEKKRKQTERIESKLAELNQNLATLGLEMSSVEANLGVEKKRLDELNTRVQNFSGILDKLDSNTSQLFDLHRQATQELGQIDDTLSRIVKRRSVVSQSIAAANKVIDKVGREVTAQTVKQSVTDEVFGDKVGQTRLRKLCEEGGVPGYVGIISQLIATIPQQYSKSISAVFDKWMSAFVVQDVRSMTSLIKAAKRLGVKSFAVIPLSEVDQTPAVEAGRSAGIVGPVSAVLKVDKKYQGLMNFIAGDTVLVESEAIAYVLASEGFRTVTTKGEMFELGGRAFAFGYHDVLSTIMESLEDIESITQIQDAVESLQGAIERRKQDMSSIESESRALNKDRVKKIVNVAELKAEAETVSRLSRRYRVVFRSLSQEHLRQQKAVERLSRRLSALGLRRESIGRGAHSLTKVIEDMSSLELERMLSEIEAARNDLILTIEDLTAKVTDVHLSYTREKADLEQMLQPSYEKISQDLESAETQLEADRLFVQNARRELQELSRKLADLDSQLQKVLEASSNSRPVLQEFDNKIRRLREERDASERSAINTEREILSTQQNVASTLDKVEQALSSLRFWGYDDVLEVFEGSDYLLSQLEFEYEELARSVNKIAEREYAAVYDSYRNLSVRINELEQERNAIVRFIENVEAEKRKVFMTAFESMNREFGVIFARLTSGSAWLELEKPEEPFSGGVFMMGSFKGKPAWESSSMSGGEKSITAVSLILAIQTVNPHPFYMFDEIDQNLDQSNSTSLAAFLRARAKEAQLIVVTLKDTMVAESNVAYGVYSVGGLSRIVRSHLEVQVKSG